MVKLVNMNFVKTYKNKTILITGASGYIGSALSQFLSGIDCKLILLTGSSKSFCSLKKAKAKISLFQSDISKKKTWELILPGVDYLFHLAALEYDRANYNLVRDWEVNALSVFYLLEVCHKNKLSCKIIFSNSANIFGLVDALPVSEKTNSNPGSLWSAHKFLAENYLSIYSQRYGIKTLSLRLSNVYGPSPNKKAIGNVVINKMIIKALKEEVLLLYDNKDCFRDYIFLEDVIRAFLYSGATEGLPFDGSFYIIASGERKSISDVWHLIADKVKDYTQKEVKIRIDKSVELELLDRRNFIADTRLFQKKTGWKPQVFISKGIDLTIAALVSKKERKCKILKRKR